MKKKPRSENPAEAPAADSAPLRVLVNMAMTADGKITTANRAVSSFSSPADEEHLLELRARADAVMAGARTVDLNPVNLGPGPAKYRRQRLENGLAEFNLRVIVTGRGSINPKAEIFKNRFSPIIVFTTQRAKGRALRSLRRLADEVKIWGVGNIDFPLALRWLREKWNVKTLLCEGGGELNDALFRANLVDELYLTISPKILGGQKAPTICDGVGFPTLAAARNLKLKSSRQVGDEMFLVFERERS
jgi:riboflavin-specific deaminase-like protein